MNLSGISQEEFERLQRAIDVDKWLASERAGHDLCGTMEWCPYCIKAEVHPCAKAKFRRQLDNALKEEVLEEGAAAQEAPAAYDAEKAAEEAAAEVRRYEARAQGESEREDARREEAEKAAEETAAELRRAVAEEIAAASIAAPEGYEYVIRYRRSFQSKLIQNESVQDFYTELKNALLGYGGVKSRVCKGGETFRVGKERVAKFCITGKTLSVYLALDPAEFEDSRYRFEDVSDKKSHAKTPMRVKITGRRAVRRTKELLELLAHRYELSDVGCIYMDFHYPYRNDEYLIERGLIKPYRALVKTKKA